MRSAQSDAGLRQAQLTGTAPLASELIDSQPLEIHAPEDPAAIFETALHIAWVCALPVDAGRRGEASLAPAGLE
ncbi:MAG: hypothetical protein CMJ83_05330 [Planctomycetes bacterium]|nr:hypothetical protein [Planctomycetota bacterium]